MKLSHCQMSVIFISNCPSKTKRIIQWNTILNFHFMNLYQHSVTDSSEFRLSHTRMSVRSIAQHHWTSFLYREVTIVNFCQGMPIFISAGTPYLLRSCVVLFSSCNKVLGCYKLGHRCLLPRPFQFIVLGFNLFILSFYSGLWQGGFPFSKVSGVHPSFLQCMGTDGTFPGTQAVGEWR